MKSKKLLFILTITCLIAVIVSCVTGIGSPEQGKGTLVVIPLEHTIENDFDVFADYYIQINDLQTEKKVRSIRIPDNRNFVLIRSLDPGEYYIAGYKWRTQNNSGDLVEFYRDDSPFQVKRGIVSFTPYGFGWFKGQTKDGKNAYRFDVLRKDDGILHNEVLRQLLAESPEAMALWDIPEITDTTIPSQIAAVLADAPAKPFELEFTDVISGDTISMKDLLGKVVVIDFWATWCPPCVAEIPTMIELYQTYKSQGLEFIGISLDEKSSTLVEFCKERGISWPQYCEEGKVWDTEFSKQWRIKSIPQLFILDQKGEIVTKEARGRLHLLIPELLGIEDERVFGFYNFNGTGMNEVTEPYAAGYLQMRAVLPAEDGESAYAALTNTRDFENNTGRFIAEGALHYASNRDDAFPPYKYVADPHVSVPDLQSREFSLGMGFSISDRTSRVPKSTVYLNMTDEKSDRYFALRRKEIDQWWNGLSNEERIASRSIYQKRNSELLERLNIKTEKRYRMTLLESGFVGRWCNLFIESDDKESWELVMTLNNIDWRIPLDIEINTGTLYDLWINFDFPSRRVDFWLNGEHKPVDISYVSDQSICPSGGAENFAMQLMPGGMSPESEFDYFFIANGTRSYSEIEKIYKRYYQE